MKVADQIMLTASLALLIGSYLLPVALGCSGGTAATVTPPPPAPLKWFRCKAASSEVVTCEQGGCSDGEEKLQSPQGIGYQNKTICELPSNIYYQMCYDFSVDTITYGDCQADYVSCVAPGQLKLGSVQINDHTCGGYETVTPPSFYRCVSTIDGSAKCRPTPVGCAATERSKPEGYPFATSNDCLNPPAQLANPMYQLCYDYTRDTTGFGHCQYVGTCTGVRQKPIGGLTDDPQCTALAAELAGTKFHRCIAGNVANCRPSVAGCEQPPASLNTISEIRWPTSIEYLTSQECTVIPAPTFEICYDYSHSPTTELGTCIIAGSTCNGKRITPALPADSSDYRCGIADRQAKTGYIRCANNDGVSAVNCRPQDVATCNPDGSETKSPTSTIFPTTQSCSNYAGVFCGYTNSGVEETSTPCSCVQRSTDCPAGSQNFIDLTAYASGISCTDICVVTTSPVYYYCSFTKNGDVNGIACLTTKDACTQLANAAASVTTEASESSYDTAYHCIAD